LRISVVGNINIDLNAVIGDSVNSEENRIKKLGLSSGGSAATHGDYALAPWKESLSARGCGR
jgi:hypothetical protein